MPRTLLIASFACTASAFAAPPVDFATQIRPIFNQNCVSCHGGVKAAGDISYVYRDVLTKVGKKSGRRVIVPGQPGESELIARVTSADKDYRMPPADHAAALPPDKIALLREWIQQGAPWQDHWAFVPPVRPNVPVVAVGAASPKQPGFPRASTPKTQAGSGSQPHPAIAPIDAFIRARLAKEGILPSPEAPRAALLRRVAFDLTGLPPAPEEIAAYTSDSAPDAFERQVDRLLASPQFGERWASYWLDLARYADSKGYEKDDHRTVWQYRDWLVRAFNRNLPYDKFVIEQLAGDLLPNATMEQHIATGFHRQTQVNDEGGTDDEEYRIAAVVDRVATTWQVTSAVTFNCAQCHSHPYEPIRQQEDYQLFAFFNGTRDADFRDEIPTLRVPDDPARIEEAWRLRREADALRREVVDAGKQLEASRAQWRPAEVLSVRVTPDATIGVRDGVVAAEGTLAAAARYELTLPLLSLSGEPPTALRFEVSPEAPEKARHTPERGFIVTEIQLDVTTPDGAVQPVRVGRFFPDTDQFTTITTKALAKPAAAKAAEVADRPADAPPAKGRVGESAAASKQRKKKSAKAAPVANPAKAGAMPTAPEEVRDVTLEFHFAANPTISGPRWVVAALREPLVAPPGSTLHVTVLHSRQITEKPAPVRRLRIATSADARWNALARDPEVARKAARVSEALAELAKIPGTELPVMEELPESEPRETRLFVRGNFLDKTGAPLPRGVPSLFPPLPAGAPANRLTLARWFFQPGQPLTARVAVNRFWEQLFGTGLVATVEDFGSVGERPSHPELLDWLAVHFERDLQWDLKALLREIVTSATYRQEATIRSELVERDPLNRLLARGPRQRLTAEMVRDQSLAASGLLSGKMGGPPVMPPQPAGVWQTVYNAKDWVEAKNEDRYRRALYTFWKRSAPYPAFLTFDLPARDLCTVRRTPTNTPLQALVTLNDAAYAEVARALAARVETELGDSRVEPRIARLFELVISRPPTPTEAARLKKLHDDSMSAASVLTASSSENGAAAPPVRPVGEKRGEGAASPQDSAAAANPGLRAVAAAVLNLDAAFVR